MRMGMEMGDRECRLEAFKGGYLRSRAFEGGDQYGTWLSLFLDVHRVKEWWSVCENHKALSLIPETRLIHIDFGIQQSSDQSVIPTPNQPQLSKSL